MADDLMDLPLFDGRRPDDADYRLTGSVSLDPPVGRPMHNDETIYAVVELSVTDVNHKSRAKKGTLTRKHVLQVQRIGFLDLQTGGDLLLESHRAARSAAGIDELDLDAEDDDTGGEG